MAPKPSLPLRRQTKKSSLRLLLMSFFLFLRGDYEFIYQRMVARRGHYMKADMLRSQFDTLEAPSDEENVLTLDIQRGIDDMAVEVERHLIDHRSGLPA